LLVFLAGNGSPGLAQSDPRAAAIASGIVVPIVALVICVAGVVIGRRRHLRGNWVAILGIVVALGRLVLLWLSILGLQAVRS